MVAELCAITANLGIAQGHWKRTEGGTYKPADFLPTYRPPESEDMAEKLAIAKHEVAMMNMAATNPHGGTIKI